MIIPVVPKTSEGKKPDIGQYHVIKKQLDLWFNSNQNMVATDPITIPDFEMPKGVEKIRLIDTASDNIVLRVPRQTFTDAFVPGKGYQFDFKTWRNQYRVL